MPEATPDADATMRVAALFAGIGGIEMGLARGDHQTELLCELDPAAQAVLREQFPDTELHADIRSLDRLPDVDIVTAGFPCQDLSQAGRTAGIGGNQSSLVEHVFRLLDDAIKENRDPKWVLLENVPFMLQLERGEAMRYLVSELEAREYRWAYRVVDTRAFGLPQRRQRVVVLASRQVDPRPHLLEQDLGEPDERVRDNEACGFYWTEGLRGLGWAVDAIPTLKGGSGLGIPSPPAIWMADGEIVLPDIRDAERLQGFAEGWTEPARQTGRRGAGARWKLVGNAVSVPMAAWVGDRLAIKAGGYDSSRDRLMHPPESWPRAAWGERSQRYAVARSAWPVREDVPALAEFLRFPTRPLSERATAGFLSRARVSTLNFPAGFLEAVENHLRTVSSVAA
jgi:DNA (cytosine-5)-methyltransferase 1